MSTTGEMYTTIQYYRPKLATHNGDSLFGCNTVTLVWDDTLEKGVQILGNEIDLEIPVNTPPDSLVVVAHAPLRGDHKIQVFRTKKIGPELAVVSENCSAAVKQIVEAELTPQMLQKSIRPLGVEPIATKGLSYNGLSYFQLVPFRPNNITGYMNCGVMTPKDYSRLVTDFKSDMMYGIPTVKQA